MSDFHPDGLRHRAPERQAYLTRLAEQMLAEHRARQRPSGPSEVNKISDDEADPDAESKAEVQSAAAEIVKRLASRS